MEQICFIILFVVEDQPKFVHLSVQRYEHWLPAGGSSSLTPLDIKLYNFYSIILKIYYVMCVENLLLVIYSYFKSLLLVN